MIPYKRRAVLWQWDWRTLIMNRLFCYSERLERSTTSSEKKLVQVLPKLLFSFCSQICQLSFHRTQVLMNLRLSNTNRRFFNCRESLIGWFLITWIAFLCCGNTLVSQRQLLKIFYLKHFQAEQSLLRKRHTLFSRCSLRCEGLIDCFAAKLQSGQLVRVVFSKGTHRYISYREHLNLN